MPHIVLNGNILVKDLFLSLKPILIKNEKGILKTINYFLSQDENAILVETITIQNGRKINFFLFINQRDDGIVIRIFPSNEIEKTDGIKAIMAELAHQIMISSSNEIKYGKTNIEEFLIKKEI